VKTKFSEKSPLEQSILTGLYGPPELKQQERQYLLGQFRERVIKVLSFAQIAEPGTYQDIRAAIAHPQARRLIISRRADLQAAAEYIHLARQHNLSFTTVDNPAYKGSVGLVVAAENAVDFKEISVPDRTQRLLAAGVPQAVIDAQGQGLCQSCLDLIERAAPEERKNYRKLNLLDRILGYKCPCQK